MQDSKDKKGKPKVEKENEGKSTKGREVERKGRENKSTGGASSSNKRKAEAKPPADETPEQRLIRQQKEEDDRLRKDAKKDRINFDVHPSIHVSILLGTYTAVIVSAFDSYIVHLYEQCMHGGIEKGD